MSRFNHSLHRLLVSRRAVAVPDSDGGCQCALHNTPVKRGQDSSLRPSQKAQVLVGLLYDIGCVGGPLKVTRDVQAQVFTGGHHLHSCSSSEEGRWGVASPPKVHNNMWCKEKMWLWKQLNKFKSVYCCCCFLTIKQK